ncbi:DUF6228 family protein [Streptomyces sp. TLI_185]|uniref:DUF6228 family protein n=1 Tax=Streptomyces sp. TLI_185 TaxID=2485151 RepID=UPI001C8451DD|nr:DUF6228 family protein [Streptomyces sp. TLI_185]
MVLASRSSWAVYRSVSLFVSHCRAWLATVVCTWSALGGCGWRRLRTSAADVHGWDGARTWHTIDEDLALSAVFRSGRHVGSTWTLRPWRTFPGSWNASVAIWLEAGEELAAAASDIRHFLEGNA